LLAIGEEMTKIPNILVSNKRPRSIKLLVPPASENKKEIIVVLA